MADSRSFCCQDEPNAVAVKLHLRNDAVVAMQQWTKKPLMMLNGG